MKPSQNFSATITSPRANWHGPRVAPRERWLRLCCSHGPSVSGSGLPAVVCGPCLSGLDEVQKKFIRGVKRSSQLLHLFCFCFSQHSHGLLGNLFVQSFYYSAFMILRTCLLLNGCSFLRVCLS